MIRSLVARTTLLIGLILLGQTRSPLAAIVVVDRDANNSDWQLTSAGGLLGFPGDYLSLPDGVHDVTVIGPNNVAQTLELTVQGTQVALAQMKQGAASYVCSGGKAWTVVKWDAPTVSAASPPAAVTHIKLQAPEVQSADHVPACQPCLTCFIIGCLKFGTLSVSSEPAGAQVWVNGAKQPQLTNVTLTVPVCKGDTTSVLLRMQDRVNCVKQVTLTAGSEEAVTCQLSAP